MSRISHHKPQNSRRCAELRACSRLELRDSHVRPCTCMVGTLCARPPRLAAAAWRSVGAVAMSGDDWHTARRLRPRSAPILKQHREAAAAPETEVYFPSGIRIYECHRLAPQPAPPPPPDCRHLRKAASTAGLISVHDPSFARLNSARHAHRPKPSRSSPAPPRPEPNERIMTLLHGPPPAHRPPPTPTLAMLRCTPQAQLETTSRHDFCDPVLQRPRSATFDRPAYHPSEHNRRPLIRCPSWRSPQPRLQIMHLSLPGFSPYSNPIEADGRVHGPRRAHREQRGKCNRRIMYTQ